MRAFITTLVGGAAVGIVLTQGRSGGFRFLTAPYWIEQWLPLGSLIVIAVVVGFVAAPRGALVAFGAFVLGVAGWVVFDLRPGLPGTRDVWGYVQWGHFIFYVLPSAIGAAIIGAIATWVVRSRLHRASGLRPVAANGPKP